MPDIKNIIQPAIDYLTQQNNDNIINADQFQAHLQKQLNPYQLDNFNQLIADQDIQILHDQNDDSFFDNIQEDIQDASDELDFQSVQIIANRAVDLQNQVYAAKHALYYDSGEFTPMEVQQLLNCLHRLKKE